MNCKRIGVTTTVPVEIIYAAGHIPVDLNNIFITSPRRDEAVTAAELAGFPRTVCGWIKGIYGIATASPPPVDMIIAVTEGDCSQTHALMETLEYQGFSVIPFSFPFNHERESLRRQMEFLADALGTSIAAAKEQKQRLDEVRSLVWEIDRLTWQEAKVSGFENHYWQVSCSDFEGNPEAFGKRAKEFIREANERPGRGPCLKMGLIGVPPIIDDIYSYLEEREAGIIFNEVQRQFSMPEAIELDLIDQYLIYTYPYHVRYRVADIAAEIKRRNLNGIIHYTQSFCFRQIEDLLFRRFLEPHILSIEGDQPGLLDARTKMRIDTFLAMLR